MAKFSLRAYLLLSKFRKRKRQFLCCVHLLHKAGSPVKLGSFMITDIVPHLWICKKAIWKPTFYQDSGQSVEYSRWPDMPDKIPTLDWCFKGFGNCNHNICSKNLKYDMNQIEFKINKTSTKQTETNCTCKQNSS